MSHEAEELRENPGYQLWLVSNAWQRALRKVLQPLGLTNVQFAVLSSMARLQGESPCVTQSDVCRIGLLDPNMASEVVRTLKKRGLVEQNPHPSDRRAYRIELTEAGEATYLAGRKAIIEVKAAFFAPLGEEAKRLAAMLETLVVASEA